jgi:uncharacterized protein (TIGR00255 family)
MTGYGRGQANSSGLRVVVELRSVNHRFLDLQIKLPRAWSSLESETGKELRGRLQRGRVEVYVKREVLAGVAGAAVVVDTALAAELHAQSRAVAEQLDIEGSLSLGDLMRMPGVLEIRETTVAAAEEAPLLQGALSLAIEALVEMRSAEGAILQRDLLARLDQISALVAAIRALADSQAEVLKERLLVRVAKLLGDNMPVDVRIAQEVALLADKSAVDEELTRLDSHVEQAGEFLQQGGAVGRQLVFLVQEMNREANTCGSKSGLEEISRLVVDLKSTIEKIREQVANLE